MKELIRLQIQVATGRFTLPVVILLCLCLWGMTFREWNDLMGLAITSAIGYVMIETNTAFTLIRTRSALPVCIYGWIASSLIFLHPFDWTDWVPLAFILSVHQFFRSYESPSPTNAVFHAFLLVSLGSLALPQFLIYALLLWGSMVPFRAMNGKSFLASLIGLATPYWFLFGYAFCSGRMPVFFAPLQEMIQLYPMDYSQLPSVEIVSWVVITVFLLISSIHYGQIAYMDKTRTRIYHSFLAYAGGWTTLLSVLQPVHLHTWMSIQLICMAFLTGHLFSLTRNRFSGILFIVTFVSFILLTSFLLWMQYFNS